MSAYVDGCGEAWARNGNDSISVNDIFTRT